MANAIIARWNVTLTNIRIKLIVCVMTEYRTVNFVKKILFFFSVWENTLSRVYSYLDNQFNFGHITIGSPILLVVILGHCYSIWICIPIGGRIEWWFQIVVFTNDNLAQAIQSHLNAHLQITTDWMCVARLNLFAIQIQLHKIRMYVFFSVFFCFFFLSIIFLLLLQEFSCCLDRAEM